MGIAAGGTVLSAERAVSLTNSKGTLDITSGFNPFYAIYTHAQASGFAYAPAPVLHALFGRLFAALQ
jgi:hypothetical protein